ncbi:MAG: hypothetical protein JWO78_715, partial [Micavibrio sp.]|nr:hypothetical protein [Micavibrio sp.]
MSKIVKDTNKDTGMMLSPDPSQALNEMMMTI